MIFAVLSVIACYTYGSIKAGIVISFMFFAIGFIQPKRGDIDKGNTKVIYVSTLYLVSAFIIVFLCQLILNESTLDLGGLRILLNGCISLIICLLFSIPFLNISGSILLASGILAFFTTANNYVFLFRGSEISPSDILSIGTAANVAAEYKVIPNGPIVYAWLLLVVFWFFLFSLPKITIKNRMAARIKAVIVILACAVSIAIGSKDIQILHFMQTGSVKNGYILNFVLQIQETVVSAPEGYNADNIKEKELSYVEGTEKEKELPDIFIVMDESYADLSILGSDLRTNIEVSPFISSMSDNTIKGYALSSVFGGGTPNSEYEFLSGNSMFFLPKGSIVYQQYIKNASYTMLNDFREKDYYCVAMHPCLSNGWERQRVYPLLGYDESCFLEDYPQENMLRGFVSDQEAFEELAKKYENLKEVSDKNTFIFLVTMQNHGAYTYEGDNYEKTIDLEGYIHDYSDAEQYLSIIHETDNAVRWLVNYLQTVDHEVVLVFYGDHLPKLDDRFYQEIHGGGFDTLDEQNLEQTVPFFIWTNYDIEEETIDLTSFNYLSNYMYKAAGMELPAYNQFLTDVEEEIPAINALGYYSKADRCFKTYQEAEGEEAAVLNEYHQFLYNCMFDKKERNDYFFPIEE